jgi:hypothetical protein
VVALIAGGCGAQVVSVSSSDEPALHIVNVDGPEVSVLLGAKLMASVPCGGEATISTASAGRDLPWDLVVVAEDGGIIGSASIPGPLPRAMLIRGRTVMTGTWPTTYGPAPSPFDAQCATPPAS